MIPHKLELKNFLSYGEPVQTIDFRQHTLICLSGKNGNGKSALLDALTWALWGQARKIGSSGKADEGLLRLGSTRMMVSFEFEVNHIIYRVRREFAKTYGRPYAALDCEVYDATADTFVSLTDKTIRATQEKIESIIGIDFETFINSAFLRQGQANEFSKKTAKDRKQILATILGLSHYDNLAQLALDQVRMLADEKKLLNHQHDLWLQECAQEEAIITSIGAEKEILASTGSQLVNITQQLKLLEAEQYTAKQKFLERQQQEQSMAILATKIHGQKTTLQVLIEEWKQTHKRLLHQTNPEQLEAEKQIIDTQLQALLQQKQNGLAIQEELLATKERYSRILTNLKQNNDALIISQQLTIQKFELAQQHIQTTLNEKETTSTTLEKKRAQIAKDQSALETIILNAASLEAELLATKTQFEKRKAFYQAIVQKGNWLKTMLSEMDQRKNTLSAPNNPSCPLCEQVLTVKRKQFLQNQMVSQELLIKNRIVRIGTIIRKLKDILYIQHQELERYTIETQRINEKRTILEEYTKRTQVMDQEQAAIDQEILTLNEQAIINAKELSQAQLTLETLRGETDAIIATNNELLILKNKVTALEQQRSNTTFDPQHFDTLAQQKTLIDEKMSAASRLTQEKILQQKRRHSISLACQEIKNLKNQHAQFSTLLTSSCIDAQSLEVLEQSLARLQSSLNEILLQKDNHLQTLAKYEHTLGRIHELKEQVSLTTEKITFLNEQIDDYQTLSSAFNKNGIQALLIEQAIPEIEAEANALLGKLTDNQSHIFIESLKDLKSGGVKETLDIHISDTAGIRPYEMFSGGEAFRVDFALRIAISKLLARRAGTSLQTLIIDEGFGSQDEEGLAHIMDALYAIQKDFAKIIVVSHLAEFKDNFPVHFTIEKNSLGSTVTIQERG